jgi:hypothetical protein
LLGESQQVSDLCRCQGFLSCGDCHLCFDLLVASR